MKWPGGVRLAVCLLTLASPASAHPVPFSYLDVQLQKSSLDVTLVVHIFDLAHDLQVAPPELLLEPAVVAERESAIRSLVMPRLEIDGDGRRLPPEWSAPEILRDRQSLRLHLRYSVTTAPGRVALNTVMFPYDP